MTLTKSFDAVRATIESNGDALFHTYIRLDKHIVKKNRRPIFKNRHTGRSFIGKDNDLRVGEIALTNAFRRSILKKPHFKTIDGPVWAVFWFFFPKDEFYVKNGERAGKISKRIPDLSNLYEHPQDCLQKAGILLDDHLICSHDLSRRLPSDHAALEIFLFRYPLDVDPHLKLVK